MTVIDFGGAGEPRSERQGTWSARDGYAAFRDEAVHEARYPDAHYAADARYATNAREGIGARFGRLMSYMGAVASVSLMVGLGVWGWNLVTADVTQVPVIKALAGEARTAPVEPGGTTANTGLAVNEVPAGVALPPQAEVAIAPAPVGLTPEDVAMGQFGVAATQPGALSEAVPPVEAAPMLQLPDAEAAQVAAAEAEAAAAQTVVSDAPAADAPVDQAVTDLAGAPATGQADAIETAVAEAVVTAPTEAVRPARRPQRLARAEAPVAAPEEAPAARVAAAEPEAQPKAEAPVEAKPEAKPETKPAAKVAADAPAKPAGKGGMTVQIGAFDSADLAAGEWSRVAGKNGALFDGKSQVVQKTEKNGRTFWRLRVAGFGSRDEARSFCASLKAKGTDCIPTASN